MCAAVGVNPLAVTLPLTLPSSLIVIVPLPDELAWIGGTSCAGVSSTFIASASASVEPAANAAATDHVTIREIPLDPAFVFIVDPSLCWLRPREADDDGPAGMGPQTQLA